jgi:hypothetical protein
MTNEVARRRELRWVCCYATRVMEERCRPCTDQTQAVVHTLVLSCREGKLGWMRIRHQCLTAEHHARSVTRYSCLHAIIEQDAVVA